MDSGNIFSAVFATLLSTELINNRKQKPRSEREIKARAIGYKIGRPIGVIAAIVFVIAMIVLVCS